MESLLGAADILQVQALIFHFDAHFPLLHMIKS